MGAQGTATLDFGAFPGSSHASVAVTGQASIVAGSLVEAWIRPDATDDHSADEHMLETIKVVARDIVASTGFTIHGINSSEVNENFPPYRDARDGRGAGTRIYGQWTVAWVWN